MRTSSIFLLTYILGAPYFAIILTEKEVTSPALYRGTMVVLEKRGIQAEFIKRFVIGSKQHLLKARRKIQCSCIRETWNILHSLWPPPRRDFLQQLLSPSINSGEPCRKAQEGSDAHRGWVAFAKSWQPEAPGKTRMGRIDEILNGQNYYQYLSRNEKPRLLPGFL